MDYTGFYEFPFPSVLTEEDSKAKDFFLALPDEKQLEMLNGCHSYDEFHNRVIQHFEKE